MLIHIMYPDNHYDYVKEFILDNLIKARKIAGFRRASGWVSIGVDRVRTEIRQNSYNGEEKRAA